MIQRLLEKNILEKLGKGKIIILTGPRQVGKTTLAKTILKPVEHLFLNADDPTVRTLLTNANTERLKNIIGRHQTVFIDEAQRIENIGVTLKLIHDSFKVQLIVSGSSAFELNNSIQEPLTGRKWEYKLLPISWKELENHYGFLTAEQQFENRLLFGMYPDVLNNPSEEKDILKQLTESYLYKDILAFSGIRKPEVLEKLLKALAFQIGNEVSYSELAQTVGIDKNTVNAYITLLEQAFVVFKLTSFSRNLRNEIKQSVKIYFYDLGVRNTVIGNFNPLGLRNDKGALWENFLVAERLKKNLYEGSLASPYFWRTTQQQEIDYIETFADTISAFEFKWNADVKVKFPKTFVQEYQPETRLITRNNFRDFIL